jgi:hypothetical protein
MANGIMKIVWPVCLWTFIAIKVAGTSFAAWSWWWVLLSPIPVVSLITGKLGL